VNRRNILLGLAGGAVAAGGIAVQRAGGAGSFAELLQPIGLGRRGAALATADKDDWALQVGTLFTASTGNADLAKIGLAHFFERTVAARHVGALKPDPAIFHKVIEGTDLQAEEVVYVGDDPHLDVAGARGAGMQAIWIDRQGVQWPAEIAPPAHTIRSLTELAEVL
jgi:phosphoglycolate phosphatase-like HAD superfamily hydrolase